MPVFRRATLASAAFALLLSVSGPAFAQEAQTPPPADPRSDDSFSAAHLRIAQEVIELTRSDLTFDEILPDIASRTQQIFTRANPALTLEIEDSVMEAAIELAAQRADLSRTHQLIWARRFTEEELAELKAFFGSELGTKFVETTPVIATLAIGAGDQWRQRLSAEMVERTRTLLREKGHSL